MVLRVRHVEEIFLRVEAETLRTVKARRSEVTIPQTDLALANAIQDFAVQRGDDEAVVIRIAEKNPSRSLVSRNFARVGEKRTGTLRSLQFAGKGRAVDLVCGLLLEKRKSDLHVR